MSVPMDQAGATPPAPPVMPNEAQRLALAESLRSGIPLAMRQRAQWLLWREEIVPGRNGIQKVPYYVNGARRAGDLGTPQDTQRLTDFETAVKRFVDTGRFSGVAFAFLKGDGLVGIDLDDFCSDDGELRAHHRDIIKACGSYTEVSPSGAGLHIICAADAFDSFKHDPCGVEVYSGDRYFTCTGRRYAGTPAEVAPLEPYALAYLRMVVDNSKAATAAAKAQAAPPPSGAPGGGSSPHPTKGEGGRRTGYTPPGEKGADFRRVNEVALQALGSWVPALFPKARVYQRGYRVRSKDLGRELEEDLQILPEGVMDFGEERGMSPIDLVLRWGPGIASPKDAMLWLAQALGLQVTPPRRLALVGGTLGEPPAMDEPPPVSDADLEAATAVAEPDLPDEAKGKGGKGGGRQGGRKRSGGGGDTNWGLVQRLLKDWAVIYGTDHVFDGERLTSMPIKAMRLLHGNASVKLWSEHPERRTLAPEQIKFEPGAVLPPDCINLFDGLPTVPVECTEADVKPMLDLLDHLCKVSAGTQEEVQDIRLQLLRWCALIVQQPGAKMRFAIVMHGPQGTGKNMFCDALRRILGKYGKMVGQTELEDRFNGYMSGKLLLIGNEVVTRQELWHNKNKLKWVITEDEIPIRGMHQEVRWESNHANIIFLSNELQPVAVEWDDRRHLVIYTPAAEDPDLYLRVADFLADDGLGKWMHYLQQVDLDDFTVHTKPLMTKAKEALIDLGLKPAERFMEEWLSGLLDLPLQVCSAEQLFRLYMRWCDANGERDFKGQAMFTRTAERYVKERARFGPDMKRLEPALAYKVVGLHNAEGTGERRSARCWVPKGTSPPDGMTEGAWAWHAVEAFDRVVARFGRRGVEDAQ